MEVLLHCQVSFVILNIQAIVMMDPFLGVPLFSLHLLFCSITRYDDYRFFDTLVSALDFFSSSLFKCPIVKFDFARGHIVAAKSHLISTVLPYGIDMYMYIGSGTSQRQQR